MPVAARQFRKIAVPLSALCIIASGVASAWANPETEVPDSRETLRQAWQKSTQFIFTEAYRDFAKSKAAAGELERERELGEAIMLLGLQPRTQNNILRAQQILRTVIEQNPQDLIGLFAKFYLARIYEVHTLEPSPEIARDLYMQVLEARSGNPMLELAASRIAYADLYAAAGYPKAIAEAERNLRPLTKFLLTPAGRREFHTAVANSLNNLDGDREVALGHILEALKVPNPMPQTQSQSILLAAELARSIRRYDIAREYYTRFVNEFQRDNRNYSVRKILENLPIESKAGGSHGEDT